MNGKPFNSVWYLGRLLLVISFCNFPPVYSQVTHLYKKNLTHTWESLINEYDRLASSSRMASLTTIGSTNTGKPMHLFVISKNGSFTPESARKNEDAVLFILNGIHPGESSGIDASLLFAESLLKKHEQNALLYNVTVCIVPVYNVGGMMNRSAYYRPGQIGPEIRGFRANARNIDLNRDFIKADTENTRTLVRTLRAWNPDFFLDTHTTNGSEHQYVMTLIATQPQKLGGYAGKYLQQKILPWLYAYMEASPYGMIPYVNYTHSSPRQGISGFMDYPRYSSGYNGLFGTFAFISETHSYKLYEDRVKATFELKKALISFLNENKKEILEKRNLKNTKIIYGKYYPLNWRLDTTRFEEIYFRGYAIKTRTSPVTGIKNYYYDKNEPWEDTILYQNYFTVSDSAIVPHSFIISQAWPEVIERLHMNDIQTSRFFNDTLLTATALKVENYSTSQHPDNGRYKHYDISITEQEQALKFYSGDYIVQVTPENVGFLMQTLQPQAPDSYFAWNFFDEILSQKEYFSGFTFDTTAFRLLEENPSIKLAFEKEKANNEAFNENHYQQLDFIYKRSPYAEKSYLRLPVFKIYHDKLKH